MTPAAVDERLRGGARRCSVSRYPGGITVRQTGSTAPAVATVMPGATTTSCRASTVVSGS